MSRSYLGLSLLGIAIGLASVAGDALAQTSVISQRASVSGHASNGPLDANGNSTGLTGQPFLVSSDTLPVSLYVAPPPSPDLSFSTNSFFTRSIHIGAASADQETLRASADLKAYSSGNVDAKTYSDFTKDVIVLGQPGQLPGHATTLDLKLHISGDAKAGWGIGGPPGTLVGSPPGRVLSTVDTHLGYRVLDLSQRICSGGECSFMELAHLGFTGRLSYDSAFRDAEIRYGWNGFNFTGGAVHTFSGGDVDLYLDNLDLLPRAYSVDSGLLLLQIDSFVGNTLRISGGLDVFVQAIVGSAIGNFSHTFDADLSGIGESPGVFAAASVPEPGIHALMALGLCLVGFVARRRKPPGER